MSVNKLDLERANGTAYPYAMLAYRGQLSKGKQKTFLISQVEDYSLV
jgi:hypothetical protein